MAEYAAAPLRPPARGRLALGGNVYDARELGGALGDLGTLVPFLAGYLTVTGLDPSGVLVTFGLASIAAGLWYRTPIPVQPMKGIGSVAIARPDLATPGAIAASALVTGVLWLGLGLSGAVAWIARLTARPVVQGVVLGLGLTLMLEAIRTMAGDPLLGVAAVVVAFWLLARPRVPAMLVLLAGGIGVALAREPGLAGELTGLSWRWRLPVLGGASFTWPELVTGALVLGLPQAALTLGNAVLATAAEHNRLFPARPVTPRALALDHGAMNLAAAALGGAPLCRGAGGLAAHVRFGARTGGAPVLLGALLLLAGLGLADSIDALLRIFPAGVLGTILLVAGLELATSAGLGDSRADRAVALLTAGGCLWNAGVGYLAGLALWHVFRRGWLAPWDADERRGA